jgi:hypothetical protein
MVQKRVSISITSLPIFIIMNLQENINRIKEMMGVTETDGIDQAVIEITKPLSFIPLKYYYQVVPYWKTKQDTIFISKGGVGKTISTKNIRVLRVFSQEEEQEMMEYLNNLREHN